MVKNLSELWEKLAGPVYRVVDEHGENVALAKVRELDSLRCLYVDNVKGWKIVSKSEVNWMILEPRKPTEIDVCYDASSNGLVYKIVWDDLEVERGALSRDTDELDEVVVEIANCAGVSIDCGSVGFDRRDLHAFWCAPEEVAK